VERAGDAGPARPAQLAPPEPGVAHRGRVAAPARRAGTVVALGLAALVVAVMGLAAFAITSEYGVAPNGGGFGEVLAGVAGGLPGAALVTVLVAVGARRLAHRRRLLLGLGGAVVGLAAVGLGMLLGQVTLEQRCAERGTQHSAACPGFVGRS
jgi:hypothetical protein